MPYEGPARNVYGDTRLDPGIVTAYLGRLDLTDTSGRGTWRLYLTAEGARALSAAALAVAARLDGEAEARRDPLPHDHPARRDPRP